MQHDAEWIPAGCPGAGNILVFNNGQGRPDGNYSSVDEIVPPVDADGEPLQQGEPVPGNPVARPNAVFRADRYGQDFPGLQGKDLTPGDPIELP